MSETSRFGQTTIIPAGVISGLGVAKDIYVRHHNFWHQGETMLLITFTNEEITGEEVEIVMDEARKMLITRN